MSINRAQIRQFITTRFDDIALRQFCFDYFPEVVEEFTSGMSTSQKIMDLITHCEHYGRYSHLLAALEKKRPLQFKQSFGELELIKKSPIQPELIRLETNKVFISYSMQSDEDSELARELAKDLQKRGKDIWIAPDNIEDGELWLTAIERGLAGSDVYIVLLSPSSLNSAMVDLETKQAIILERKGRLKFLPIQIEKEIAIPIGLQPFHIFNFDPQNYQSSLSRLINRLAALELNTSIIHPRDGKEMVRVPAGVVKGFIPFLGEYWIDKTPVTNAEYALFLAKNPTIAAPPHWKSRKPPFGLESHPVVHVSWYEAREYALWAGKAVPSGYEWEKAWRGSKGYTYPWGNSRPTPDVCNYGNMKLATTTVENYSPKGDSFYGCTDMCGNVWEWTVENKDSDRQAVRGGAFNSFVPDLEVSKKMFCIATEKRHDVGFRCVYKEPRS